MVVCRVDIKSLGAENSIGTNLEKPTTARRRTLRMSVCLTAGRGFVFIFFCVLPQWTYLLHAASLQLVITSS